MFRPTLRRSRKSHSHCVLHHSQRSGASFLSQTKLERMQLSRRAPLHPLSFQLFRHFSGATAITYPFLFQRLAHTFPYNGGCTPSSHSGTHPLVAPILYPLPVHALMGTHFATPFLSYSSRNGGIRTPDVQTLGRSDVRTFGRSVRPIAAHALWCHNPQRHEISSGFRETSPLLPVSNDTRADNGTSS